MKNKTQLTRDDVINIAHLARLEIESEHIEDYSHHLSNILDLVNQMAKVNTSNIEPMAHPGDEIQPLRQDKVTDSNQANLYLDLAPETDGKLYLVPKVIE